MSDKNILEDNNDLKELAQEQSANSTTLRLIGVVIAAFIILIGHTTYSMFSLLFDDSVPLVVCPRDYNLDAPQVMKTMSQSDTRVKDRWIRGFIRRYINAQFPRTGADAKPFYEYIRDHSDGPIKRRFQGYIQDIGDISSLINAEYYYRFYPKSSTDVRIRLVQGYTNRWTVEVDGYLIKKMGMTQERFNPTLRYIVEARPATVTNPEGLYVLEFVNEQITDYVSGAKEDLSEKK